MHLTCTRCPLPIAHCPPYGAFWPASVAPRLVFSHATEGQGGHYHLNERPWSYWEELFARHGMAEDAALTARIQASIREGGCESAFRIDNTRVVLRQS